jgi:hypothetical protein
MFESARLYWPADEPIDFHSREEPIEDAFYQVLGQVGLVLHTKQVIQCGMGVGRGSSGVKTTEMEITKAYREHGLDVDSQAEEMKARRRSAKRIYKMSASRFRAIRPHTTTTKAWVVDESKEDVLKYISTRRTSTACKEHQRRRIKVRILNRSHHHFAAYFRCLER